ncbi:MAG: glycosyltransferase family 39 protein [Paracoccaceae bacterium]
MSAPARWFGPALAGVALITLTRLLALAFNRTDLFVDEAQYWLWGQRLDFGYYSKPPLIGWLIGGVTSLVGSDAAFWVRMPGAVLHGATGLILGAAAARLASPRAAFWVALSYVTLPFATVGGLLISTDTVMAPAFAMGLFFWLRLCEDRRPLSAILAGLAVGLAFLAKYAAVYFLLGAGLGALMVPAMRVGWRNGALFLGAFTLVAAPNIIWNLTHDLTTVSHTLDNVGWVRQEEATSRLDLGRGMGFVLGQFAVFGPFLFLALPPALLAVWRQGGLARGLIFFSLPALLIVTLQATLDKAYANWAVSAYFAATLLVVPWLLGRAPRVLQAGFALNAVLAVALPLLTITAPWPDRAGKPLMQRYLGQEALSAAIIAAARDNGASAVYAADRGLLSSLFYYGRDSGLTFYAPRPIGRPQNYFEQTFPLPDAPQPETLYILAEQPVCGGVALAPVVLFDTNRTAFAKWSYAGYRIPQGCADALP